MPKTADSDWMRGVSLAYEAGGPDVNIQQHVLQLRKLLARYCRGPYSSEVGGFALALRIEGCFKSYGPEGIDRVRRNKKDRYVTADIRIPAKRWKGVDGKEFSRYLSSAVRDALEVCGNRLKSQRVVVDIHRLLLDYGEAQAEFLGIYQ